MITLLQHPSFLSSSSSSYLSNLLGGSFINSIPRTPTPTVYIPSACIVSFQPNCKIEIYKERFIRSASMINNVKIENALSYKLGSSNISFTILKAKSALNELEIPYNILIGYM